MKRVLFALGTSFVLAWVTAPLMAQDAEKPQETPKTTEEAGAAVQKIELSSTVWDFGEKWYGEDASTEITIKNAGGQPLKIVQVRSSCGCTVAKPPEGTSWNGLVMEPGQTHVMKLTYNTKKVRDKVAQTVTVTSNDPSNPTVQIKVQGGIKQLFQMTPADRVTFTGLEQDSAQSKEVILTSNLEELVTLKIKELSGIEPPFEATIEAVEEGKKYKLTVKTTPPLKLGANSTQITLESDNERFPTMTVAVSAYVAPRIQTSPMTLYVPRKAGTPIQRYIRVRYQTANPIKITGIETTNESVRAELMPPRANTAAEATIAMHEIRATLPPSNEFPAEGAEIIIRTDDKEEAYQEFRVKVLLQPESKQRPSAKVNPGGIKPTVLKPLQEPAENKEDAKPEAEKADDESKQSTPD